MRDKVTLKLELEVDFDMKGDYLDPNDTYDEGDIEFDLNMLKGNLISLVSLGLKEGLFTDNTYAYLDDLRAAISEVNRP